MVVGVVLFLNSVYVVQDDGQMIVSADLMLEQMWHYDGSIGWWSSVSVTLILPLTAVFLTMSGVVLVSQQLFSRLRHKSVV